MPLLLTIMMGSVELGNFLYNEHLLEKAVRDGARFAARQNFSYFSCSGAPGGSIVADTRNLVRTSLLSGGNERMPNWDADATVTLSTRCATTSTDSSSTSYNMVGIYQGKATGVPIVEVAASVPYRPVIGVLFGFSGVGATLNAKDEAAVMGL